MPGFRGRALLFWVCTASALPISAIFHRYGIGELADKTAITIFSLLLAYPVVEELVFRGLLQPELNDRFNHQTGRLTLSPGNLIASAIFATMHLINHAPVWAAAVIIPSLVFGLLRDYYQQLWPSLVMHIWYNATFIIAVTMR